MKESGLVWLLGLLGSVAAVAAGDDVVIADFEADTYGPWEVTGEAFGTGPARGTLPNQQAVTGFLGRGLVNSYLGGDGATGTLTSPVFKIERPYINFLVGGGRHTNETCVNLLVDGQVARSTSGADGERLEWATWDVAAFRGRTARIQIKDSHTGGWGHINVDHLVQSSTKEQEDIDTSVPYNESYRPQFHFTAPKNWHNDPNGLVFYQGEYHLFYQHNPTGIMWGNMTWAHAVSRDLIHWLHLPHALLPDKLGTVFSGSAVVDWDNTAGFQTGREKTLVAIYTAAGDTSPESKGQPFTQCIAYSNDRGRTWTKYAKNPVLPHIVGGNRDPKVVWYAPSRRWIMTLYKDGHTFAFFSSPDLKTWTDLHDLEAPGCGECPDFFEMPVTEDPIQRRWVWTAANGHYMVGTFDGQRFRPETSPRPSDWGKNFYAVQTYSDLPPADGRRIQIAWMNGGQYPGMPFNQQMSFPCELRLKRFPEGWRLCRLPVREIQTLHRKTHSLRDKTLSPGQDPLAGIKGELFDIRAVLELGDAAEVAFRIRGEPVVYSTRDKQVTCLGKSAALEPVAHRIQLQILVDRTSLEVFGNEGSLSMTSCFLPRQRDQDLGLVATGGSARIISLDLHELRSAVFLPGGGTRQ
jgi:sucrose-6-phosphate hydrolase SacC (GH32 family)